MKRILIWVVLPYLAQVLLRLVLAAPLEEPLKHDELGYLSNARVLATEASPIDPEVRSAYKVGYSLLLVPAFWVTDDPVDVFELVQVINGFLLASVYPLAFALVGAYRPEWPDLDRALVATAVSLYPAAVLYATTAMSENLFIPLSLALAWALHRSLVDDSIGAWILLGVVAALLYSVHERAVGVLALVGTLFVPAFLLGGRFAVRSLLAPLAAVPTVVALRLISPPGSLHATTSKGSAVLRRALADPLAVLVTGSGQLWYLAIATLGVLLVGTIYNGRSLLARVRARQGAAWSELYLYLSALSVFGLSVLFMAQRSGARFTHWVYGRYNEGALLPVLVLALVAIRRPRSREAYLRAVILAALVLCGVGLVLALSWRPAMGWAYSFNASSMPLFDELRRWGKVPALAVFGGAFGVSSLYLGRRWRLGVVLLTLFLGLSTVVSYRESWAPRYVRAKVRHKVAAEVGRVASAPKTIAVDSLGQPYRFYYYDLIYRLPDYDFERFRPGDRPPSSLVYSQRRFFGRDFPEARLLVLENLRTSFAREIGGLWVLPGPLQDQLAAEGRLLPAGFPLRLTLPQLEAEIEPVAAVTLTRGRPRRIELRVTHRGTVPWPHRGGWLRPEHSVRLFARWVGDEGEGAWGDLPRMLYPGESATVRVRLELPERVSGDLRLRVGIRQYPFSHPWSLEREIPVRVEDSAPDGPEGPASDTAVPAEDHRPGERAPHLDDVEPGTEETEE